MGMTMAEYVAARVTRQQESFQIRLINSALHYDPSNTEANLSVQALGTTMIITHFGKTHVIPETSIIEVIFDAAVGSAMTDVMNVAENNTASAE